MPIDLLIKASNYAHKNNIAFGCSVFHIEDIHTIEWLCDFIKISSYDCLRPDLIAACREVDKPLFISTGMCTRDEITRIGHMADPRVDDGFFHCISRYPAEEVFFPSVEENCFSAWAGSLHHKQLGCFYHGWSDHTGCPASIYAAIARGYNMFECHIDLEDRKGSESSYGHCWEPDILEKTIRYSRIMYNDMHRSTPMNNRPDREECINRADPVDGMRPMKEWR
jgi:N-acetylneuraminate synthase